MKCLEKYDIKMQIPNKVLSLQITHFNNNPAVTAFSIVFGATTVPHPSPWLGPQ